MATGGRDPDENDLPRDRADSFHPFHNTSGGNLSPRQVADQGRDLIVEYINVLVPFDRSIVPNANALREPNTPRGPPIRNYKEVANALIKIADEIDGNAEFNRHIESITSNQANKELLFKVALQVLDNGRTITWGRIVSIFHFAFRLAMKSLGEFDSCLQVVRSCVEWIVDFIYEHVSSWIISQGGWEAVISWVSTPQVQLVGLLSVTVATIFWICWKR